MSVRAMATRSSPQDVALPLRKAGDLDPLMERIGDARIVCIGEASHGTHEFYAWRATLTRRLIEEKGFDLVGVEGDWPDCYRVSCSVTGSRSAPEDPKEALESFERWPTWMWANDEVVDFTRWLRAHNTARPADRRVGFYGLDVYSLWDSLRAVLDHLEQHHPEHLEAAREACRCLEPYAEDPQAYAQSTRVVPTGCAVEVVGMLGDLLQRHAGDTAGVDHPDAGFAAEQNARSVVGAEAYYRAMVGSGPESWNVRDTHMADTLDRLLEHYGTIRPGTRPRAVVWEHNTHVGDARFTDMGNAGMVNIGQLVRERHTERDAVLVGFGSHHGTVVAADSWGGPTRRMTVPPARSESIEALLHVALDGDPGLFVFSDELPQWAAEERSHRAIGVVYSAAAERWGNYVPTVLGKRYDAFLWFDETRALTPLAGVSPGGDELESWPFGE
jgi:erythromycin esterase-like protein